MKGCLPSPLLFCCFICLVWGRLGCFVVLFVWWEEVGCTLFVPQRWHAVRLAKPFGPFHHIVCCAEENYQEAKRLKMVVKELCKAGEVLCRHEVEKKDAIAREDYDTAKAKKVRYPTAYILLLVMHGCYTQTFNCPIPHHDFILRAPPLNLP